MRSATSRTAAAATSDALQVVMDDSVKTYPTSSAERAKYVNPRTNKPVTAFQFQVYDLCAQVRLRDDAKGTPLKPNRQ